MTESNAGRGKTLPDIPRGQFGEELLSPRESTADRREGDREGAPAGVIDSSRKMNGAERWWDLPQGEIPPAEGSPLLPGTEREMSFTETLARRMDEIAQTERPANLDIHVGLPRDVLP